MGTCASHTSRVGERDGIIDALEYSLCPSSKETSSGAAKLARVDEFGPSSQQKVSAKTSYHMMTTSIVIEIGSGDWGARASSVLRRRTNANSFAVSWRAFLERSMSSLTSIGRGASGRGGGRRCQSNEMSMPGLTP